MDFVSAVLPGKSFAGRGGRGECLKPTIYDQTRLTPKLSYQGRSGGQEIYIVVVQRNVEVLKAHIEQINRRYFKNFDGQSF